VAKPREIEVKISQGKDVPTDCRGAGITDKTYYSWRREYYGMQIDLARRLKQLEQENARLKLWRVSCTWRRPSWRLWAIRLNSPSVEPA